MERHRPPAQGARGWGALENDVRYRAEVRSRTEEVVTFPTLQDPMRDLACKGSCSRQRWLSVDIALMARPRLMLLDEPSLDTSPTVGAETFATIRDPARHRDMRVLVVKRNARTVAAIAVSTYAAARLRWGNREASRAANSVTGPVSSASMNPNVVVGAGIVGLAVAMALQELDPLRPTLVLEKESGVAAHQTGHNSGGHSLGALLPTRFAEGPARRARSPTAEGVLHRSRHPLRRSGKLVVATREEELPKLGLLLERGRRNGVPVRHAEPGEVAEREPALRVRGALVVESTGRVDYREVAAALAEQIITRGGTIRSTETVTSVEPRAGEVRVHTAREVVLAHRVAVCAGLQSDRLARSSGIDPGVRILPFRGEYSELVPGRSGLVRRLVYPVPDPDLPFLGHI